MYTFLIGATPINQFHISYTRSVWLVFALIFPFLFAAVYVIDSYCVGEIFEKPILGMIVSSIASLAVFLPLPFILPLLSFSNVTWQIMGAGVCSGIIIQVCQALYFESLDHSDSGIVSAYWNMISAFVPLISYFLLKEILNPAQYIGISILIASSVCISIIDSYLNSKIRSFFLIFLASWLYVVAVFLMDWLFANVQFYVGFLFITTGIIITGLFPLLFIGVSNTFKRNLVVLYPKRKLFICIELLNLMAHGFFQLALKFGTASLVSSMETLTPAYAIIIALLFKRFSRIKLKESTFKHIPIKFFFVGTMVVGVLLIAA